MRVRFLLLFLLVLAPHLYAERIKDLVDIAGVRSNQLIGYGLVAGLQGTGDGQDLRITGQSLQSLLSGLGVSVDGPISEFDLGDSLVSLATQNVQQPIQTANLAAVLVTAEVPPFAKPGQRIDVNIATVGAAESLRGGNLILTELRGIDGEVYALAQGSLTVTGIAVDAAGAEVNIGVPTSGRIPNGAILERLVPTSFQDAPQIVLNVRNSDFSTTNTITNTINDTFGPGTASSVDGVSIAVRAPEDPSQKVAFLSEIEQLDVDPGAPVARVVINSRTGTVVINNSVRVGPAAVSHGTLMVRVTALNEVVQPNQFGAGQTAAVTNADIQVTEDDSNMFVFEPGVELQDIVDAMNQVGASPSALIAILDSLKKAGSLNAELVII